MPESLSGKKERLPVWGIGLRFALLLLLFNGTYYVGKKLSDQAFDLPYTRLVTLAAAGLGEELLPIPVERRGELTLGSGCAAVVVRDGCNGVEAIFLMLAGILACPGTLIRKGKAVLLYLPALFTLNLVRILLLLFVISEYPEWIDFFHYQVGQTLLVIFIFAFWVHYVGGLES